MRGSKGILGLVLLLAIALVASVPAGSAAGTSGDTALAAKKKCKKKKPQAAKKKKCKKKKKKKENVAPVVRATLNWSNGGSDDVDMDLFVFAAGGQQAGNGSDAIPSSTLSPDLTGPAGSETFTDLAFNQKRPLSFGVCYQVGGSVHTDYTITFVTADGVSHTDTRAGDNSLGSSDHVDYPGGAPIPSGYCPN